MALAASQTQAKSFAVVSSGDLVRWDTLASGPAAPADGAYTGLLAASSTELVALAGQGASVDCRNDASGQQVCDTAPVPVWNSTDGRSWKRLGDLPSSDNARVATVAGGARGFVAAASVGAQAAIWFSPDGASWSRLATGPFKDAVVDYLTAVPGGFVATGSVGRRVPPPGWLGGSLGGSAAAWWSADGRSWYRAQLNVPKGGAEEIGKVYVGRGGMVAIGYLVSGGDNQRDTVGAAWTSADGRAWSHVAIDSTTADEMARQSFTKSKPLSFSGLIVSDGDRIISIVQEFQLYPDAPYSIESPMISESFDGRSWTRLSIAGDDDAHTALAEQASDASKGIILPGQLRVLQRCVVNGETDGSACVIEALGLP